MKNFIRWPVLWWLRFWARLALRCINPYIIGITGSAGKTSAVEAIRHVAALKFNRVKVAEKANSESGIPADILGLHFTDYSLIDWLRVCFLAPIRCIAYYLLLTTYYYDVYVVELGVDEPTPPKNMDYLLTIFQPHIGVVLNVFPVHAEQFGRQLGLTDQQDIIAAITKEKGRLVTENSKLQTAVLNADQLEIVSLTPRHSTRVVTFGKSKKSDVVIESVKPSLDGTTLAFRFKGPGPVSSQGQALLRLDGLALPDFYGHTFASALAVGLALDIDPKDACDAISKNFKLPPGRGQIFQGIKNTTIIDSSYNASRETMIGSLELLQHVARGAKRVAVLGDMRELGLQEKAEHEAVARIALETLDEAILVGPLMKQYVFPILEKKIPTHWFEIAGEAARFIPSILRGGEVILVKGSQNTIFLEIVVEALLADKGDVSKLCRRETYWDQRRASYR